MCGGWLEWPRDSSLVGKGFCVTIAAFDQEGARHV